MEVDKGGLDIRMSQEIPHAHNVQAHFQEVGGIAMSKAMGSNLLFDPAVPARFLNDPSNSLGR